MINDSFFSYFWNLLQLLLVPWKLEQWRLGSSFYGTYLPKANGENVLNI